MTHELEIERMGLELEEFGELEGSEAGEYWCWLARMSPHVWQMGDELKAAYKKELKSTLDWVRERFEIFEGEVTITEHTRELREKIAG